MEVIGNICDYSFLWFIIFHDMSVSAYPYNVKRLDKIPLLFYDVFMGVTNNKIILPVRDSRRVIFLPPWFVTPKFKLQGGQFFYGRE